MPFSTTPPTEFPWHASQDPEVPRTIAYEEVPLFAYLDRAARDYPKRVALRFQNYKLTYAELKRKAEVVAANLRRAGVRPGDAVSIMLPNLPQTVIAFWAVLKAGGVGVMTNPLYMEKELVHQIKDSGARHMIVLDKLWPKVASLRAKLGVETYIVTTIPEGLAFPLNLLYRVKEWREQSATKIPYDGKHIRAFGDFLKGSDRLSAEVSSPRDQIALLQYTGGTTGVSKGVMLTHFNLGANLQQIAAIIQTLGDEGRRTPEHRVLAVLPLFHVYGLTTCLLLATSNAATLLTLPRFSPHDTLKAIDKYKPSIFPGAPAVYMTLMNQKDVADYDLKSITVCVSGSAPMPMGAMRRFEEMTEARILEGYGLTEASPVTHLNPIFGERKSGSIGLPFPDTEARIVDMEVGDVALPPGKVGELILRGPQVMKGYWNRPDETASTLRNGWLYTGDIGYMDETGYFYIVDRKKDMIIQAGYNVYPREIDEVLLEHPKIKEAVSVGIPHPQRGEVIKAYVVVREGQKLKKSDVTAFCRQKLAAYKVPRLVEFREELPRTIVGKVLRRALREEEEKKLAEAQSESMPKAPGKEKKEKRSSSDGMERFGAPGNGEG